MDYENSRANKAHIQDKIRDGTGAWDEVNTFNFDFYQVKDNILTTIKTRRYEHPRPHYDLRTHRATYLTNVSASAELSRKSVFWFWNTPLSPAQGFAVISYLGPPYEPKPHGNAKHTLVPYTRPAHSTIESFGQRYKEKPINVFQECVMRADALKASPPRAFQQVCDAQHRARIAYGLADSSKNINAAEVCN